MVKLSQTGWYLGEYRHNLTEKNRLALPRRIRAEIDGTEIILSRGFEACIAGFDKAQWKKVAQEQLNVQFNEDKGRHLRRQIFSSAMIVQLDRQGRMVLPETLLSWAGLQGKVGEDLVVIGAGDHFEIWSQDNWQNYSKNTSAS